MADDMAKNGRVVTAITLDVIAGHSSLPCADYVNLSATRQSIISEDVSMKIGGYAGQARV
jgi:hypothetical protein